MRMMSTVIAPLAAFSVNLIEKRTTGERTRSSTQFVLHLGHGSHVKMTRLRCTKSRNEVKTDGSYTRPPTLDRRSSLYGRVSFGYGREWCMDELMMFWNSKLGGNRVERFHGVESDILPCAQCFNQNAVGANCSWLAWEVAKAMALQCWRQVQVVWHLHWQWVGPWFWIGGLVQLRKHVSSQRITGLLRFAYSLVWTRPTLGVLWLSSCNSVSGDRLSPNNFSHRVALHPRIIQYQTISSILLKI